MSQDSCQQYLDPRIRRTRLLLQQGLEKLLIGKEFDQISVQEIADAATVNRATFYDHYLDKFALLESMVGTRFYEFLVERGVQFDGTCGAALHAIVLAACDYVVGLQGPEGKRRIEPHTESAMIAVVRRMLLKGLQCQQAGVAAPEIVASTAAWAIYGAVREWSQTANRCAAEQMAHTVAELVAPILERRTGGAT